jgi:UDP-glucose 4-epimerase
MKNIAVTGVSGYIGSRLVSRLDTIDSVQTIIGIDIRQPTFRSPKLKFYRQDVLEPFGDLFVENEVDAAIHLAFVLKPTHERASAQKIDVEGTINFVRACRQAKVVHALYLSSHTVYGAHHDNPIPLTEDSPLRPLPDFQYSWDKAQAEQIVRDFGQCQGDVTVTILRCCPVIGPHAVESVPVLMFKPPVMIGVAGFDPRMQFVHEHDLIQVIKTFLNQEKGGIFNVAGQGNLRYSEVAKLAGRKLLRLPDSLIRPLMHISWALHLQNDSPYTGLEFIKYPPVVSTRKLLEEIGFRFQYSTEEALSSFISTL